MRCLVLAALAVAGCVGQNPEWDDPTALGSTSGDRVETAEGSSSGTVTTSAASTSTTTAASSEESSSSGESSVATAADTSSGESGPSMPGTCDVGPPAMGPCPEGCTGGCEDGVCVLACGGEAGCDATQITCPQGWPCRVDCLGKDTCKDATIVCPGQHACEVQCAGDHACEKAQIGCGDGPCSVACTLHEHACTELSFGCGAADGLVTCDEPQDREPELVPHGGSMCTCESVGC